MSVITVERIKLFSTRSPWWCMVIAAFLTVGFAALTTGFLKGADEQQATIFITQPGAQLSQMVMMVMAALAVTTEYRFGTIRTSFQAVPQRAALLLGKTAVVAVPGGRRRPDRVVRRLGRRQPVREHTPTCPSTPVPSGGCWPDRAWSSRSPR